MVNSPARPSVWVRLVVFTAIMLALAGVTAAVCYGIAGSVGLEVVVWSTVLCLPPGWLVFSLEPLYRLPRQAINGALLSSMFRLGLVTLGVLVLVAVRPELPRKVLIGSLAVMYSGSLFLETWLLMRGLNLSPIRSVLLGGSGDGRSAAPGVADSN